MKDIWGKLSQNPDRCTKEFVTEPRKLFELVSDDTDDVSDVTIICTSHTRRRNNFKLLY